MVKPKLKYLYERGFKFLYKYGSTLSIDLGLGSGFDMR